MPIESNPNTAAHEGRPRDQSINGEPRHGSEKNYAEAARDGHAEFFTLLRAATLRTLLRYIEDGLNVTKISEIPNAWKKRFSSKGFRNQPYTWRNPFLYLLSRDDAARLAMSELLRRLQNGVIDRSLPDSVDE